MKRLQFLLILGGIVIVIVLIGTHSNGRFFGGEARTVSMAPSSSPPTQSGMAEFTTAVPSLNESIAVGDRWKTVPPDVSGQERKRSEALLAARQAAAERQIQQRERLASSAAETELTNAAASPREWHNTITASVPVNARPESQPYERAGRLAVSEQELRTAYEQNTHAYERVKARHIFVAFGSDPSSGSGKAQRTVEEARVKADRIRALLLRGADFATVAKAESDDERTAGYGGALGQITRGQMVRAFEDAAFTTPVGAISPVVRSDYGFHILRVDGRSIEPFEEARADVARRLEAEKLAQAARERMLSVSSANADERALADAHSQPAALPADVDFGDAAGWTKAAMSRPAEPASPVEVTPPSPPRP